MTRDEAKIIFLNRGYIEVDGGSYFDGDKWRESVVVISEWLKEEPCTDAISRQTVIDAMYALCDTGETLKENPWRDNPHIDAVVETIEQMPSVTSQQKMGHCKDCKKWKDSDGVYRRGIGAESQCPINRREVFEGNGYCYMFETQESKDEDVEYQRQIEQLEHDILYEPTFNPEDGSM